MKETFAIVLNENMTKLDQWFVELEGKTHLSLSKAPRTERFCPGDVLIISQDSHNRVFAAVGCLCKCELEGRHLSFKDYRRFAIPVVLTSAIGESSPLLLDKGYMNDFMYLDADAAAWVTKEADALEVARPIDPSA